MRCCAGDEGFVALRSRPVEGGFKPVGLDYRIGLGRTGGLGSSLSDHFGRLPARALPDGTAPATGVEGCRAFGAPA